MVLVPFTEVERSGGGTGFVQDDDSFTFGHSNVHILVRYPSKDVKRAVRDRDMKRKGQV